jgi:uncharacterized protein YndB with AHSA1/START domain
MHRIDQCRGAGGERGEPARKSKNRKIFMPLVGMARGGTSFGAQGGPHIRPRASPIALSGDGESIMTHKSQAGTTAGTTNTVHLHRVLTAKPEKIYRAFLEADAMARWLPPNGFTGKVQHMDAKVGGTFKMSFTSFTTGKSHSFGGEFLELVPHERMRYTDKFDDPTLPGEMQVTVTFKKVSVGTELQIEQAGIPSIIPLEVCYLGWQQSLAQLAMLVEPDIPS